MARRARGEAPTYLPRPSWRGHPTMTRQTGKRANDVKVFIWRGFCWKSTTKNVQAARNSVFRVYHGVFVTVSTPLANR
jgi:hypothetical protein